MYKIFLAVVLGVSFHMNSAMAANLYAGNLDVSRLRVHNLSTYFGTTSQPAETCSAWGEYFKFDHTTETGKAFLSMLMTAKTSGQKIQVWYTSSTAPGTNQTSGCNDQTISILNGVALK